MINAAEARKRSNEILNPVTETPEFKTIMNILDIKIREAIEDGLEKIEVIGSCLQVLNNYAFPKFINRNVINGDTFWWPFVKTELEKLGFKIHNTMTCDHYMVAW